MIFFMNAIHFVRFKTINKDNSYFYKNTRLSFDMGPTSFKGAVKVTVSQLLFKGSNCHLVDWCIQNIVFKFERKKHTH